MSQEAFLQLLPYFALEYTGIMSYAKAADSCAGSGASTDPRPRLYNEKMVVCMVRGFTSTDLAKELNEVGILKFVSGY